MPKALTLLESDEVDSLLASLKDLDALRDILREAKFPRMTGKDFASLNHDDLKSCGMPIQRRRDKLLHKIESLVEDGVPLKYLNVNVPRIVRSDSGSFRGRSTRASPRGITQGNGTFIDVDAAAEFSYYGSLRHGQPHGNGKATYTSSIDDSEDRQPKVYIGEFNRAA